MRISSLEWLRAALLTLLGVLLFGASAYAATVSGTVTNNTSSAGRVYLIGQNSGGGDAGWGKSIAINANSSAGYSIRGVNDGTYIIRAFLDTQNLGMHLANNPVGTSAQFTVSGGANPAPVDVTLSNPANVALQPPVAVNVVNGDSGVMVAWDPAKDANGLPITTTYRVYWSTGQNPGPLNMTGGGTSGDIIEEGDHNVYFRAFTNSTALYFAVTAVLNGTESAPVNANGGAQVIVGPQTGGVTVSGTITISGATPNASTPLYLALGGNNGPPQYVGRIAAPTTNQAYSIAGVQPGSYSAYAILDMNNDGHIGPGDITNTNAEGTPFTVAATNFTNANVTLTAAAVQLLVRTDHWEQDNFTGYSLNLEVGPQMKRAVNAAVSGPNLSGGTLDMAISDWGPLQSWAGLSARPVLSPADTYSFAIEYSDGSTTGSSPLTAPVTGIVDSFINPASPVGYVPHPFSPAVFSWNAPTTPPTPFFYSFYIQGVPGFNSDPYYRMPDTTTSVTPTLPGGFSFSDGSQYSWEVGVMDSLGNRARRQVNFAATTAPAITSFTPTEGIPGTSVTINGFNFGATIANNQVTFNGTVAAITSATSTQIVATVPDTATTGEIAITNQTSGKPTGNLFPATFTVITPTPPTTTANPAGGNQTAPVDVFLTTNEPATIYYTTNGADPTLASASFVDSVGNVPKGPINISGTTTLKFFAVDLQGAAETIRTEIYTFLPPTTLSVGLSSGSIVYGSTVTATATITSGAGPTGSVQFLVDGILYGTPVSLTGTTASKDITGIPVTGSPHTILAVYSGDANWGGSSGSTTVTVTKAALAITASDRSKTYGQAVSFAGTEFTATGLQNGETVGSVTLTSGGAAATANFAGSPYAITASSATGGTFNANNYTITYNNGAFTVNKAALAITASNQSKSYGQAITFAGTEFATSGLQNGESVGAVTLASSGAAATANFAGSPYTITIGSAIGGTFDANNYTITYNTGQLTVNKAALTITASNQSKVYGDTVTFTGTEFTTSGLQNSETVGSVTLASSGAAVTAAVAGSPYTITASSATGGTFDTNNYTIGYSNGQLTVTPKPLTVTQSVNNKIYDGTRTASISGGFVGGFINGETGTLGGTTTALFDTKDVGNGKTVTITGLTLISTAAENYSISSTVTTTADITPKTVTVTAAAKTKVYGAPDPALTYTSSGLVSPDTISGSLSRAAGENVGDYAITQGDLSAGSNYTISFTGANLSITKASQTITFNALPVKNLIDGSFTLAATASSGLGVSYVSSNPAVASISGSTVTLNTTGSVTITASQAGDSNWNAATSVGQTLTIITGQTITVNTHAPATAAYNSSFTVAAISNSGLTVTYSSGSPAICTNNGATFTMHVSSGDCIVQYDQAGNGTFQPAPQVTETVTAAKANQTITFGALATKTYGNAAFNLAATTTSPLTVSYASSDPTVASVSGNSVTILKAGSVTITASQAGDSLYNPATSANQTLTINKAPLTVTADAKSKVYGTADPALTYTYSALAGSDTAAVFSGSLSRAAGVNAGTYAILQGTLTAGNNYQITFVSKDLTITKATPVVTWSNPANISYGTQLSLTQLNATATAGGSFVYTPPSGTKLQPGMQTLTVNFTPTDTANYNTPAAKTVQLRVLNPTGDLNNDGKLDLADALLALKMSAGVTSQQLALPTGFMERGDVGPFDGTDNSVPNNAIDSGDAVVMLRKIVNLVNWI